MVVQGSVAVTFKDAADDPIYEPPIGTEPLWSQTLVVGLFTDEKNRVQILKKLNQAWLPRQLPEGQWQQLPDQVWERTWMDGFEPMQFGTHLWIVPSWLEKPDPGALNILLDPGIAFGTGTHPTTRLCLEWLDGSTVSGKSVIDFGCGSGILAIAAALKGAHKVICTDIDPQALMATRENAHRNGISEQLIDYLADSLPADIGPVDLMLANILAGPLVELAPQLAKLTKAMGTIVLSGILAEQSHEVLTAYSHYFKMEKPTRLDGWVRLVGIRSD
jgi:ribosomal protein L11 methyltransferase